MGVRCTFTTIYRLRCLQRGDNMRYFAQYNDSGRLVAIGAGLGGVEITKEEFDTLRTEIRERAALVNRLYTGKITIADVPAEWQEEVQQCVDERVKRMGAYDTQDIPDAEALNIILGVSE